MYYILFICSSTDEHLYCFLLLAIVRDATYEVGWGLLLKNMFLVLLP